MPSNGAVAAVQLAVGWTLFLTILKTSRADSESAFMLSNTVENIRAKFFGGFFQTIFCFGVLSFQTCRIPPPKDINRLVLLIGSNSPIFLLITFSPG